MVVVAGVVLWCLALGPVVALLSGGQISLGDGWFSLGQLLLDPSTSDEAAPGLTVMLVIGGVGLGLAAAVRVGQRLRGWRSSPR